MTRPPEHRAVLLSLLKYFLDQDGPGFPDITTFRLAHEPSRAVIDGLEGKEITTTQAGGYRLTFRGLQACGNEDASRVVHECNRILEQLKRCYREKPREVWEAKEIGRRIKLSEVAVSRRLLLLSDVVQLGSHSFDVHGAVSKTGVLERILDAVPLVNPQVIPLRGKLRIESLIVENFRGFAKAELVFDDRLTVVTGVNGAGKTSLLDAAAIILQRVHERVMGARLTSPALAERDIQHGKGWARIDGVVSIDDQVVAVRRVLGRKGHPAPQWKNLFSGAAVIARLSEENEQGRPKFPLAIKYPVTRAVLDVPARVRSKPPVGPGGAYVDALTDKATSFRHFFAGFRSLQEAENADKVQRRIKADRGLDAIRGAIESMVPGLNNLRVEVRPRMRMMATKDGKTSLEVDSLSDGERCMLALAGDLAWRLAAAFPLDKDPLSCPAVVLIDEVDLHLHPRWQRQVVQSLLDTFTGCQFIITTHSPQVMGAIKDGTAYRLDGFKVSPQELLYGYSSNYVLEYAMDAVERQKELSTEIAHVEGLLEGEGDFGAARRRLEQLRIKLPHDPDVMRLLSMARFLEE